jgi:hypothetical protein
LCFFAQQRVDGEEGAEEVVSELSLPLRWVSTLVSWSMRLLARGRICGILSPHLTESAFFDASEAASESRLNLQQSSR